MENSRVQSESLGDFVRVMAETSSNLSDGQPPRLQLDPENVTKGLGQLVLTLLKLVHQLLERQAVRRMDAGSLSDEQIEKLGLTLMRQTEELEKLRVQFGLEEKDLNLDLGPLGKLI